MIIQLVEAGASFFDSILAVWFLTKFNYAGWRRNYCIIPAILIPFCFQLFSDAYLQGFSLISTSIQFILILTYAFLICKGHYYRAICSACIYKICLIVINSCIISLFSVFIDDFTSLLIGGNETVRYLMLFFSKLLMLLIFALILKFYNRESNGNLLNGILTFCFTTITVLGLKCALDTIAETRESQIRNNLFVIAIIFLSLNLFLYILLSQLSKLQKRNFELKLLGEKSKFEETKYQEALAAWQSAEKIRHDVKHHMAAILGMIDDGDTGDCRKYIEEYLSDVQKGKKFSGSGNTVIDYLLDSKLSPLENTQIIVTGSVGSLSDIRDTDLASLIGNILDNAVEAQKNVQIKRIELHFVNQNDNRMIICKNAVEKSVLKENRNLISTKSGSGHGYGHQIVAEIVKKYNGLLSYFEESDLFGVQIVLPKSAPM